LPGLPTLQDFCPPLGPPDGRFPTPVPGAGVHHRARSKSLSCLVRMPRDQEGAVLVELKWSHQVPIRATGRTSSVLPCKVSADAAPAIIDGNELAVYTPFRAKRCRCASSNRSNRYFQLQCHNIDPAQALALYPQPWRPGMCFLEWLFGRACASCQGALACQE
jgi:hypothetical protein